MSGERHETGVLWPWDCLQFLWNQQKFRGWAHDIEEDLEFRVEEFWKHLEHLPFYTSLQLDNPAGTIPIAWHADGVKVYKTQKVWVYSFSSCIRKGPSLATKMLFVCIRDSLIVKFTTHDSVGRLIGYCMDVMMTGNFPEQDFEGAPFQPGSVEAQRAGSPFCGGWKFAFAAFKGDQEARVLIHKLVRNWAADSICEHCLASKLPNGFVYGDFSDNAAYFECLLSHSDFLALNPSEKQSAWVHVKGWQKDRNLDDPH